VNHNSVAYVGIDTSKLRNAVAVAEKGVAGTFGISAKSTPRKRGDAQARYQTCGQIPSAAGGRPLQDEDHRRCHRLRVGGALNQPGQYPDRLLSAPSSFLSICSQLHTEPHCLLMRGPQATLESAGNHSRFDLLARERLQHADIFLCPRSNFFSSSSSPSSSPYNVAHDRNQRPDWCCILQPADRAVADVVGAGDLHQRLSSLPSCDRFTFLVCSKLGVPPELHPSRYFEGGLPPSGRSATSASPQTCKNVRKNCPGFNSECVSDPAPVQECRCAAALSQNLRQTTGVCGGVAPTASV
jgi:hypothetical protein